MGRIFASAAASIRWCVAARQGAVQAHDVRGREQLVERDVAHAELALERRVGAVAASSRRRPSRSPWRGVTTALRDRAEPDQPERRAPGVAAEHEVPAPRPRPSGADQPVALDDAPRRREHQREREVGGRLDERVGRVRRDDAGRAARLEVDVVVADGEVRDDLQLGAGRGKQRRVDAVGRHRDERRGAGRGLVQLLHRQRPRIRARPDLAVRAQPLERDLGQRRG